MEGVTVDRDEKRAPVGPEKYLESNNSWFCLKQMDKKMFYLHG